MTQRHTDHAFTTSDVCGNSPHGALLVVPVMRANNMKDGPLCLSLLVLNHTDCTASLSRTPTTVISTAHAEVTASRSLRRIKERGINRLQ